MNTGQHAFTIDQRLK